MLSRTALLVAAGVLIAPLASAAAQPVANKAPRALSPIGATDETAIDNPGANFDLYGVSGKDSAMVLAVNGRVVATAAEETAHASPGEWNWTLLLLGCAGLVMTTVPRRAARRMVIPS